MSFTGYNRPADCGKGGVGSLRLLPVSDIAGCDLSGTADSVTALKLRSGATLATIQFVEHSASFRQTSAGSYPHASVVHEIAFDIARSDPQSVALLQSLSQHSAAGFAAIVTLQSGTAYLVGWSPRFGAECPLRSTSLVSLSGNTPDDAPLCRITLRSQDTDFALPFRGNIS